MPTHRPTAVVSCLLLIGGCMASPQPRPTQPSPARPVSTPARASDEVLVVGMGLGDALEMITRHGIDFRIDNSAWGPAKEVAAAQLFIVERDDVDDALLIYAESESGETMRVRTLKWWRNYQSDSRRAKGEREWKEASVHSLPVAEVERQFSFALNPWDSEKAESRRKSR